MFNRGNLKTSEENIHFSSWSFSRHIFLNVFTALVFGGCYIVVSKCRIFLWIKTLGRNKKFTCFSFLRRFIECFIVPLSMTAAYS